MESYFPKALWFKEWREHRWRVLLAVLIIGASPAASLFLFWSRLMSPPSGTYAVRLFWNQFNHGMTTFTGTSTTGIPAFVVVMMIAVILVTAERSSGSLWYILSTPVPRSEWIRTKFLFGLSVIWATYTLLLVWNGIVGLFDPVAFSAGELIRWWVYMLAVQGAVYAMTFVVALCVSNAVLVFIGTLLVSGVPAFIAGYIHETALSVPYHTSLVVQQVTAAIDSFSPFSIVKHQLLFSNPFLYWYMFMIAGGYVLAQTLMRRVRAEHLNSLLTFPKLWYVVITAVSLALGTFFASAEMALMTLAFGYTFNLMFVPLSLVTAAVVWLLFYSAIRFRSWRQNKRRVA